MSELEKQLAQEKREERDPRKYRSDDPGYNNLVAEVARLTTALHTSDGVRAQHVRDKRKLEEQLAAANDEKDAWHNSNTVLLQELKAANAELKAVGAKFPLSPPIEDWEVYWVKDFGILCGRLFKQITEHVVGSDCFTRLEDNAKAIIEKYDAANARIKELEAHCTVSAPACECELRARIADITERVQLWVDTDDADSFEVLIYLMNVLGIPHEKGSEPPAPRPLQRGYDPAVHYDLKPMKAPAPNAAGTKVPAPSSWRCGKCDYPSADLKHSPRCPKRVIEDGKHVLDFIYARMKEGSEQLAEEQPAPRPEIRVKSAAWMCLNEHRPTMKFECIHQESRISVPCSTCEILKNPVLLVEKPAPRPLTDLPPAEEPPAPQSETAAEASKRVAREVAEKILAAEKPAAATTPDVMKHLNHRRGLAGKQPAALPLSDGQVNEMHSRVHVGKEDGKAGEEQ